MKGKRLGKLAALLMVAAAVGIISIRADIARAGTDGISYESYLGRYAFSPRHAPESAEDGGVFLRAEGEARVQEEWQGHKNVVMFTKEGGLAVYSVRVKESGLYRLALEYSQTEETAGPPAVRLRINGEVPFDEAREIAISQIYRDQTPIRTDQAGNEIAPKQERAIGFRRQVLRSATGYEQEDYCFWLEAGENEIALESVGESFAAGGVRALSAEALKTEEEYLAGHPGEDTSGILIEIPAETALFKSDSVLYPNYDRVNAATRDQYQRYNNPKYIRINTIGGALWKDSGQWITWEFEVPESGYYQIGCKYRQNFLDGLFTSRDILIDGETPFEGLAGVKFRYDDEWRTKVFSDEEGREYRIWLEAGRHEITLRCTMGEFSDTLRRTKEILADLNDLYRRIIMITSSNPDRYTDYFLNERLPDMLPIMKENEEKLIVALDDITRAAGGKGSRLSVPDTLRVQLGLFLSEPEEITNRLTSFKNNISALGSWIVEIQSQALTLDYLFVKSPDVEAPANGTGFFKNLAFRLKRFLASFDDSASAAGTAQKSGNRRITVWLNSAGQASVGRDQAQVLKDLIEESFTPQSGIEVNLELVQGSLIEASLAGMGPDVALMNAEDQPVNFAIRGALQDLTVFEDYEEVLGRFYESAIVPFRYRAGLYALPDTQVFHMLFYRTDVFDELSIRVPDTWEEFYRILPVIQRNNLQVTVQDIFPALLFQRGGSYYDEAGTRSLLDSQAGVDAMTVYTELYTKYGFEVKTDFYSRFRSGELVMSIQPYNMYNQLMAAAPEINGLWAMVPVPGTAGETKTADRPQGNQMQNGGAPIDRSQSAAVTGTVMLGSAKDKEAAWEFMKWWSSDQVKADYGIALEGIMGPSARFTPANPGTLPLLPWSKEEQETLGLAWKEVIGIEQLPGSYYTSRGLTNAFRSVVYNGETPRYAMNRQVRLINDEIAKKRMEFGEGEDE